jgi:hypothetical protein
MPLPPWPGPGFGPPAKPRAGGHAELTMTGTKGRTGGGWLGKKNQAIVLITWPGGSTSRTIKGNFVIRLAMEWCAAFNDECAHLADVGRAGS